MSSGRSDASPVGNGPELVLAGPLTGARIHERDLVDLGGLLTDPRVTPTLTPTGRALTSLEIAARLEAHLWHWREHGFGTWIFRTPEGLFVARAGLERRVVRGVQEVELMYAVAADFWGLGHGTRVARALVKVAFGPLGLERLIAFVLPENRRSRRILDRCGFLPVERVIRAGRGHDLLRLDRGAAFAERAT